MTRRPTASTARTAERGLICSRRPVIRPSNPPRPTGRMRVWYGAWPPMRSAKARAPWRGRAIVMSCRRMTVVYVLAHFDDEYLALPLIRRAVADGREHLFIHVVDYRNPKMGARRHRETVAFLAAQGVPATSQI